MFMERNEWFPIIFFLECLSAKERRETYLSDGFVK